MKDAMPIGTMATGSALTTVPYTVIQIAGVVIGGLGVVMGVMQYRVRMLAVAESKRANDIREFENRMKYKYESSSSEKEASSSEKETSS